LRRSERRFGTFFGRAGLGAALLGLDARLRQVNDAFCAITGHSRTELLGSDFAALLHAADASRVRQRLVELSVGLRSHVTLEVRRFHKSGAVVWVRCGVSLAYDVEGSPLHLLALCEEISEEHNAHALATGQQEAFELALCEAPLTVVLGALVRAAEARFEAGAGVAVFLAAEDAGRLRLAAAAGVPRAYARAVEDVARSPEAACTAAAPHGRVTIVGDVTEGRRWAAYRELALENGIRACCAFPIRSFDGAVLGALAVYRSRAWTPEPAELGAGEQLADAAAVLVAARKAAERRERTDDALRETEQRFAAVFQQAADGIACSDPTGRFELVNDRYGEIVGRSRAELASLRIQDVTHPDDRAGLRERLAALVRGGPPCSFEQRYVRPDGSVAWVSQDASLVRDAAGEPRSVVVICQDVGERKLADALRLEQQRLLELVAAGRPLDECLMAFSAAAPRLSRGVRACALLVEASGKTLDRCVAASLPDSFPGDLLRGLPIDVRLLDAGAGVTSEDIANDEGWSAVWRQLCAAQRVAACHITPVLDSEGALLGFLVLCFHERRGPTLHERRLAEVGAHVASIAIGRERIARELEESRVRLSAELRLASDLHELGTRLLAAPDLPSAARQVLDAVLGFVGAEMGTVQVHDPGAGGLCIVAQRGFDPRELAAVPVIGPDFDSTCARALRTSERVIVNDFLSSTEFASHRGSAARLGYRAELSTPLRTRTGELVGMLNVHFAEPHEPSSRELRTIDLCTRPLAHLMERARAEAALRQHNERFRVLFEGAPYGIFLLDSDLRVRQLNANARQGLADDSELVGQHLREMLRARQPVVRPERIEAVAKLFQRTLETGEPHAVTECAVPQPDGRSQWFDWRIHRIPLPDGSYGVVSYFVDVTSRVEANRVVAASEERFRSLVSVLTDVPWIAHADGSFVTPQPAWTAFTGQSDEALGGFGWVNALHPEDREAIWKACKLGVPYEVGGRLWHAPTHQYRHFVARAAPLRNADGSVREWVGSCTDVTEQRQAESTLHETNRRKDEFLAMLGHELRNPLAALRSAITLASLDEERREGALEIAGRQVGQLARLIDDLFDVARITQGRIALHREPLAVAGVLSRAAEESRPSMDERGHRLLVAEPGADLFVEADAARLEQVLGNLLANAARYTERGGTVRLLAERDGDEAVIRVRDDGIGIAPELLSKIFEPFAQGDRRSSGRSEGGLGIGLSVVRQLVELHGGRVEARSEGVGRGAEFSVRLPALAPPGPAPAQETPAPATEPPRMRVLVVEDNRDAAASLCMLLEYMGHSARVAHDGASALEAAAADSPELVFIDIGLPDMDGYEVARRIREEPALRTACLVALTGYGRADEPAVDAACFDRRLVKPVGVDTLREVVERLVRGEARLTPD
jgi:PAS domain S-box-containing protein